ncbi:MAG TPA: substrate-binding domain-containing protein [Conexibacter sp.]|nr:substrate-binding domain-containing protein [Conexibacter sp.]
MSKLRFVALGGALVLALGTAGCGSDSVPLSGSIRIDGSRTVAPLTKAMAKRFMAEHPDVRISVGTSGTDRGFKQLCRGETDVNDAADRINAAMIAACDRAGVAWGEIPVVNDAVVLIVSSEVPVRCLTTVQLEQIWHGNSEVTHSWSQVNDLDPPWDGNLNAWGPGTDTEEFAFFTKAVNHNEGETRDYNNTLHRLHLTIPGVIGAPGNLGYDEYGRYKRSEEPVEALEVDSGDGCVAPSPETIADGTFRPLSRRLFVYPAADALARPATQAFLQFYLDNVETVAPEVGFVPLTDEQLADSKARLERLAAEAE